ncbi:hypothetical protein [Cryobacterium sp. CG_9.6]|nr:hypothetical protein [Cryobacterium sp. CG_9.6]MDH6236694.1 hypothetical protein [Cryobacterium sp. CG_9.6]
MSLKSTVLFVCIHNAGRGIDDVRPIRDNIEARVEALLAEILPAAVETV